MTGREQLLSDNVDQLHALAGALIELETLSGDEIKRVLAGERVDRNDLRTTTTAPIAAASRRSRRAAAAAGASRCPPRRDRALAGGALRLRCSIVGALG